MVSGCWYFADTINKYHHCGRFSRTTPERQWTQNTRKPPFFGRFMDVYGGVWMPLERPMVPGT